AGGGVGGRGPGHAGALTGSERARVRAPEPLRTERGPLMSHTFLIARRELISYLRSPLGYVIAAAVLLIDGIYFFAYGLGEGPRLSAEVLARFFDGASGTTMIAAIALSMRLIAGEREQKTLVLLSTAPVRDR